jgi:hypothetical protein
MKASMKFQSGAALRSQLVISGRQEVPVTIDASEPLSPLCSWLVGLGALQGTLPLPFGALPS